CIPCLSTYARYLPLGEIDPLVTGFSEELIVSCRNLMSGAVWADGGWRFASHKNAVTINSAKTRAEAGIHLRAGFPRSISTFKVARSARVPVATSMLSC